MSRADIDRAVRFALSAYPDNIGVGRLCQELLAHKTGNKIKIVRSPDVDVFERVHAAPRPQRRSA